MTDTIKYYNKHYLDNITHTTKYKSKIRSITNINNIISGKGIKIPSTRTRTGRHQPVLATPVLPDKSTLVTTTPVKSSTETTLKQTNAKIISKIAKLKYENNKLLRQLEKLEHENIVLLDKNTKLKRRNRKK